jgi:hypothetical protein
MTDDRSSRDLSEWLKVLLDEIDRRKRESEQAREESRRRSGKPDTPQEKERLNAVGGSASACGRVAG